ncbi:MAG: hypothetical protein KJO63_06440, partial [Maribacter sp.]|nr:hypothetical protein [Maribacter sp.]
MKKLASRIPIFLLFLLLVIFQSECLSAQSQNAANYNQLIDLFKDWRAFEKPPLRKGAPDYTAETFEKRWPTFKKLQAKLLAMDVSGWPVEEQVDWNIVKAEMNGYDFNHRILKPWARDPAFYKSLWMYRSDVPAHEGPTHHGTTEIWTYEFPLDKTEKVRLLSELNVIPSLNEQAKLNLTGNAKELWIAGIREIQFQSENLKLVLQWPDIKNDTDLTLAIQTAIESTDSLVVWLRKEAPSKTGPSGIGKQNYTWYLQNVHMVPL